ncbi:hypothetical protein Hamer_G008955 [Homarus americanus]|uniref:Uncharacterized protein n=1 Tax=Homarus americanus TaxID=6706 RepID=A0A8J5JHP4_HOMAM|nr:hypothetical protein Hamer_G008955 [Homarus americanus]
MGGRCLVQPSSSSSSSFPFSSSSPGFGLNTTDLVHDAVEHKVAEDEVTTPARLRRRVEHFILCSPQEEEGASLNLKEHPLTCTLDKLTWSADKETFSDVYVTGNTHLTRTQGDVKVTG